MTTVNGLWIGKLGELQILSINSFLKQGHVYKLWIYEDLENDDLVPDNIPDGVIVSNADDILDSQYIFKHWSGNLATFADIFRYKLLYENGGWWVDLDLICLKPLPTDIEYFYGGERGKLTGSYARKNGKHFFWIGLMKFPKGDKILLEMYEDMFSKINEFKKESSGLIFFYGQKHLGDKLEKVLGKEFLYTKNKYNVDLFNPFANFDMLDFFRNDGYSDICCKRWGWNEMNVENVLNNSYTVHLYNKIIQDLAIKRGLTCNLLEKLKVIVYGKAKKRT